MALPNNIFTGYNPKQLQTLAQRYGYTDANLDNFGNFLEENPARAKQYFDQQNMDMFGADKMRQFQQGGIWTPPQGGMDIQATIPGLISPPLDRGLDPGYSRPMPLPSPAPPITPTPIYDEREVIFPPRLPDPSGRVPMGSPLQAASMAGGTVGSSPEGFSPPTTTDPNIKFDADPVSYYNPDTKEIWTSPTGGWTAPQGWVQGAIPKEWEAYYQMWQPIKSDPVIPLIGTGTAERIEGPKLPPGAAFKAPMIPYEQTQLMREGAGQVVPSATQVAGAAQVTAAQQTMPTSQQATTMAAVTASPAVQNVALQAAQQQTPSQLIEAAQASQTTVSNLEAAQLGQAVQIQSPAKRALETGELVSSAVGQAAQAAAFVEPTAQAATATPSASATVQGQLATLMQQFEQNADTPIWARGAVRLAQQEMAKRGLGASSMAGQAIVEAAMEKAISIAQIDAQVIATFEKENLSNRQQMATLKAQQRATFMNQEFDQEFKIRVQNAARVSDIADRNFTAEQQIALENSKLTQTVDLQNINNKQALVMAQASALAGLDTTNLNNRQKAAVENAKNFLQLDVTNLNNSQQSAKISYEAIQQALLTDASQQNAANKINMTEQNQMDRFYSELIGNIGKSNIDQKNAINKFNAGEVNALQEYNSEVMNKRDQFNAKNQLAIEQSNAVWRREIATADTAAINFENQFNAQNLLDISNNAYDNLWQEYRDVMELAWKSGESEIDRIHALQLLAAQAENSSLAAQYQADRESSAGLGGWLGDIFAPFARTMVGGLFGISGTP